MSQSSDIGGALYPQKIAQEMEDQDLRSTSGYGRINPLPQDTASGHGPIGAPNFWWSLVPVIGSGWQAIHDFQTGHWGWGIVNTALAISDVFLVKSLVVDLGKVVGKVGLEGLVKSEGSHTWEATTKWLTTQGWREFQGETFHHWLVPRGGWGRMVPDILKNQPYNLMRMPEGEAGRLFQNAIEGHGRASLVRQSRMGQGDTVERAAERNDTL